MQSPPIVDSAGDISVHGREGVTIPVTIAGVTAAQLSFEIAGAAPITPALISGNDYLVTIPQAVVAALPSGGALFVLRYTGGSVPVVYWEGVIRRRGFV